MRTRPNIALISLGLIIAASRAWGNPGFGMISEGVHEREPKVNAALMLSEGENRDCQTGNIADAWVVIVSITNSPGLSTYISSGGGACVVLPITSAPGQHINVTGVLQDTGAIPGAESQIAGEPPAEDCFNVEGFSIGLAANSSSEYDPRNPANLVNAQGYGFFWYDSDSDLKPGPYDYTVVGCSGHDCPTATTYYNTDGLPGVPPPCAILTPFPPRKNNNTHAR
jgi:hypothetical protein